MHIKRAVIFVNGTLPDIPKARRLIHKGDYLLAADAGASHMLKMGLIPEKVIGDLDSIPSEDLLKLESAGVEFIRFPQDKNKTDLELTLDIAMDAGFRKILVVAALGGRLDMTISNISLLARKDLMEVDVRMDDGVEEVQFVDGELQIDGNPGDLVSLIPWGGSVQGVFTQGLRWPLNGEDLEFPTTRSISNEMINDKAVIIIRSGLLFCIHCRMG